MRNKAMIGLTFDKAQELHSQHPDGPGDNCPACRTIQDALERITADRSRIDSEASDRAEAANNLHANAEHLLSEARNELAATKERLQGSREHVEEEHRKVVNFSRDIRELLDQRDEHRKKIARLNVDLEEAVELAKALEQERDLFKGHSIILNTIGWKIATALGRIPDGADEITVNGEELADALIAALAEAKEIHHGQGAAHAVAKVLALCDEAKGSYSPDAYEVVDANEVRAIDAVSSTSEALLTDLVGLNPDYEEREASKLDAQLADVERRLEVHRDLVVAARALVSKFQQHAPAPSALGSCWAAYCELRRTVWVLDAVEPSAATAAGLLEPGTVIKGASGTEWVIGQPIGVQTGTPASECDAPGGGGHYLYPDGIARCRCVVCPRCGHHTGNSNQGHYWSVCSVWMKEGRGLAGSKREFHFCCPDDCQLEAEAPAEEPDPTCNYCVAFTVGSPQTEHLVCECVKPCGAERCNANVGRAAGVAAGNEATS